MVEHLNSPEVLNEKDKFLYNVLWYLKNVPENEKSVVGAGIYNTKTGDFVISSSRKVEGTSAYGKWNHAEIEAIEEAKKEGFNPDDCVLVSTLSPCVKDSDACAHVNCTDYILASGYKNIHVGWVDMRQATLEEYSALGLNVSVTEDPKLENICRKLDGYFNLPREQRSVGEEKIAYIDETLSVLEE